MSQPPERLTKAAVVVVGDAMLDRYWLGEVDRISPEAPVPIVRVTGEEFRLGGAANVALNVATLGARAALVSAVGTDEPSTRLVELLKAGRIEPVLAVDPALRTTVKLRVSGRSQQLLRIDFEDRPTHETLAGLSDAFHGQLEHADAIVFSDYGKGGLTHVATMIASAKSRQLPIFVDPKGDDYGCYRGATVITPNRAELARVIGAWDSEAMLEERTQNLRRTLSLDAILLTRSEEGMSLFDDVGHLRVATVAREVFDVTGAGDTVIAVLATMMAAGIPLRSAVETANRAAGIVVSKFGTATMSATELFE